MIALEDDDTASDILSLENASFNAMPVRLDVVPLEEESQSFNAPLIALEEAHEFEGDDGPLESVLELEGDDGPLEEVLELEGDDGPLPQPCVHPPSVVPKPSRKTAKAPKRKRPKRHPPPTVTVKQPRDVDREFRAYTSRVGISSADSIQSPCGMFFIIDSSGFVCMINNSIIMNYEVKLNDKNYYIKLIFLLHFISVRWFIIVLVIGFNSQGQVVLELFCGAATIVAAAEAAGDLILYSRCFFSQLSVTLWCSVSRSTPSHDMYVVRFCRVESFWSHGR